MRMLGIRTNKTIDTILRNMFSIGAVQFANNVIPLLVMRFVSRAFGASEFGEVASAQNIATYLGILVNYGFEYSATQDVSVNRHDTQKLRVIFWTVICFKALLFVASLGILALLPFWMDSVAKSPLLYWNAALINLGFVFFPTWFFQGIEKMAKMAIFNFIIKALGAVLIVIFVHVPSDSQLYLFILSATYCGVGLVAFVYVIRKYHLAYIPLAGNALARNVVTRGFPIFLNCFLVSLYTQIGIRFVEAYCDSAETGIYAGANKIIMGIMIMTSLPVNVALFPAMSRVFNESHEKGWRFFKRGLMYIALFGIAVSAATYLLAPLAIRLFLSEEFVNAIDVLKIMSVIPCLTIIASALTVQGLYALRLQRLAPYLGLIVACVSCAVNFGLVPRWGANGAAMAWVIAQIAEIVVASIILRVKRRKIECN